MSAAGPSHYRTPALQPPIRRGTAAASLHEPAMANHERLTREGVRLECGEEQRGLGDVPYRRELAIHGLLKHHIADNLLLGDAELLRLLRDLFVHERRAHEARTDDICPHAMLGALLGDDLGEADQSMLCRHVGRLERRGLLRVD